MTRLLEQIEAYISEHSEAEFSHSMSRMRNKWQEEGKNERKDEEYGASK
jgi:hypothetical protein